MLKYKAWHAVSCEQDIENNNKKLTRRWDSQMWLDDIGSDMIHLFDHPFLFIWLP